jgi:4-diphosphocytidyl-2-C-methyl-D-erythritol kinase
VRDEDVLRALAELVESGAEPDDVLAALRIRDPRELGKALHNDLEPAAFDLRPELADAKARLIDAGALGAVLSGSGPTLLALCESQREAVALARTIAPRFHAVTAARAPAGGPEVSGC